MEIAAAKSHLEREGYCILEGLLDPAEAERLDGLLRPLMVQTNGYVKLEGALNHIPALAQLCCHPQVMEIAEYMLGLPFFLANNVCAMWCQPGAKAGVVHADWPLGQVPQPWPPWPLLLQTMWMLTDFTAANGATRLVPGSQRYGRHPDGSEVEQAIVAEGKRGSVLIWHGALWHGNGSNQTEDQQRMGANVAYIPALVHRPAEGWPLVSRGLYEEFSQELQQLLERSVESPNGSRLG